MVTLFPLPVTEMLPNCWLCFAPWVPELPALSLIHIFSPSAVIMVGIAFGINETKQKIGDVLVSRQLMLYDLQRIGTAEGGSALIVPRGDRPHASGRLISYLQNAELDWDSAQVHFGLVLTGEKLVDNVDFRDQLRHLESEAVGGEMEGAGLYVACQDAKVDCCLLYTSRRSGRPQRTPFPCLTRSRKVTGARAALCWKHSLRHEVHSAGLPSTDARALRSRLQSPSLCSKRTQKHYAASIPMPTTGSPQAVT